MADNADKRVRVVCRIRPRLERERYETICGRKVDDNRVSLITDQATSANPQSTIQLDQCFDEEDNQQTLYEDCAQEFVDHALDGCNSTIFAYGQTGSGKTHTILGEIKNGQIGEKSGIFLRVFEDLFNYKKAVARNRHVIITLSAIELHIEDVQDLLNEKAPIKIRERGDDTLLPGVRSYAVETHEEVLKYFKIANSFRSTTATKMNDASSRSHAIFLIDLFCIPVSQQYPAGSPIDLATLVGEDGLSQPPQGITRSRISLVDLAGSERLKKTGVEGEALREANAINKSLSTLRTVIHAMYMGSGHIPYRDSKLTKLLRPAFTDPTSRLLLIGQISPCSASHFESLTTVKFCDEVKALKVATQSPYIDPDEEKAYNDTLRKVEELGADFRIARKMHFHSPVGIKKLVVTTGLPKEQIISQMTPNLKQKAAMAEQADEQGAVLEAQHKAKQEADDLLLDFRRKLMHAQESYEAVNQSVEELKAELEKEASAQEKDKEKKTSEAKKMKKSRLNAEEQLTKVKDQLKKAKEERKAAAATPKQQSGGDKTVEEAEEDEAWEEFEEDWHIAECNHSITQDFYQYFCENTQLRSSLCQQLLSTEHAWSAVSNARSEASVATLGSLLPDVIHYCVERSVDIVEGNIDARDGWSWFDINGTSKKLKKSVAWNRPLNLLPEGGMPPVVVTEYAENTMLSDDEGDGAGISSRTASTLKGRAAGSSAAAGGVTSTSPTAAAGGGDPSGSAKEPKEKPAKEKKKKKSQMQKKYESQEADKKYLMNVYDSRTLVQDVLRYLNSGSSMMKHGRSGAPHKRKFWVNNNATTGARELLWVDPDLQPPEQKKTAIMLHDVTSIQLGPWSKVFKRNKNDPNEIEYWRSFSLITKDSGSRDSVDMVATSLVDFEAWVLGLSHLCHLDPYWGKEIDLKQAKEQPASPITDEEKKLCVKTNIWPHQYVKIRDAVTEHRDEVSKLLKMFDGSPELAFDALGGIHLPQINHKGAILMTKGELRYYCNPHEVDIFRVCELWKFFHDKDLVFDPSFTPPTNFGVRVKGERLK